MEQHTGQKVWRLLCCNALQTAAKAAVLAHAAEDIKHPLTSLEVAWLATMQPVCLSPTLT
jgi:hypothetical protein